MQSTFGQVQERPAVRQAIDSRMPTGVVPNIKEIPYDYVATFILKGEKGNRVPQVINISTEGAFVAVAVAYSFIPVLPVKNPNDFAGNESNLMFLLSPFIERANGPESDAERERRRLAAEQLTATTIRNTLVKLCGIDFKYSIVDSGSGRELQNLAIHNIAGLGESNGERPFRPMAKPMIFMPRSTIRIEVEEISEGPLYAKAELFLVLHGYKMLGYGVA